MKVITVSARNYITKTISLIWAKDPRNKNLKMTPLMQILDTKAFYNVCVDDNDIVLYYAIVDPEAQVIFACGGRDFNGVHKVMKAYLKAGYAVGCNGTIPKEYEDKFINVSNFYFEEK